MTRFQKSVVFPSSGTKGNPCTVLQKKMPFSDQLDKLHIYVCTYTYIYAKAV